MTSFRDAAMIERFVDTSGWAEWVDQTLLFHARAATLFELDFCRFLGFSGGRPPC